MHELIGSLDPANLLTRGWTLRPPSSGLPLWRAGVDIAEPGSAEPYVVGAYGVSRTDTITRAAGEAVERYALRPRRSEHPATLMATAAELGARALDFAGSGLGDPDAWAEPVRWYRGWWLDSAEPVWIPDGLVDYPVPDRRFDPTPSGAASGPTLDFAVRAALAEQIERDAVSVAWAAGIRLDQFDPGREIASAPPSPRWRHFARLYGAARDLGLRPRLFRVPVLPGMHCAVATVIEGDDLAAVGAKADEDLGRTLLTALQESLQIREFLTLRREEGKPATPSGAVCDDADRAQLWLSAPAIAELRRRTDHARTTPSGVPSAPRRALPDLVAAVLADGGRPAAVDLTARLPPAHRAMGWRAVKVVVPGYQPLRMDERHEFTWRYDRIAAAGAKTPCRFPHPLI